MSDLVRSFFVENLIEMVYILQCRNPFYRVKTQGI